MKQYLVYFVSFFLLFSCAQKEEELGVSNKSGGSLRIAVSYNGQSIFPPSIEDEVSKNIVNNIHMSLFRYNPINVKIEPGLALRAESDNTGRKFVIYLDSTIYFHDDICFQDGKGRRVTAYDVLFTFKYLATQSKDNHNFSTVVSRIEGAKKLYALDPELVKDFEFSGIEVINDFTLTISLEKPTPMFLYNLAQPSAAIIPEEAVLAYGNKSTIGAGPFIFSSFKNDGSVVLVRNKKYYKKDSKGKKLPYLDTIVFTNVSDFNKTYSMFNSSQLDALLFVESSKVESISKACKDSVNYVLVKSFNSADNKNRFYNVVSSQVHKLYTNNLRILDLTEVYKK